MLNRAVAWAEAPSRKKWLQLGFALLGAVLFFLVFSWRGAVNSWELCETEGQKKALTFMFTLLVFLPLAWFAIIKNLTWPAFLFASLCLALAIYIRMLVLNIESADYYTFLKEWVEVFREKGFSALTEQIGDYNLPYMYILGLISTSAIPDLYLVKLVSIVFDVALALIMLQITEKYINKKYALGVFVAVLTIPTIWFNGSYWGQCDTIYVFFVVACLYFMVSDRPILSVAMLTIAFSFKLQTIFFFPMVLYGLYKKKYKLRHALVFPIVYLILMVPALLAGRPLISTLTIYFNQASQYSHRTTLNAPNIYQFFPQGMVGYKSNYQEWLRYIPGVNGDYYDYWYDMPHIKRLVHAFMFFAVLVLLPLLFYLYKNRNYVKDSQVWRLALLSALAIPMVLPRMHERYFMLAEVFAILYAARYKKRLFIPVLVCASSLFSYYAFLFRDRTVDARIMALMMLGATLVVLWDTIREIRRQQKLADPKADEREEKELETYQI